jgi:hypothetical protein
MSSQIKWYENDAFDAPELNSPQPCVHGAGCVYTVKDADGNTVPGCCRYVHPGEEGTGRRLFPERTVRDTLRDGTGKIVQPACVRLTGRAGFYERRRSRLSWQEWCAKQGIPFTPNKPGVYREPVKRIALGYQGKRSVEVSAVEHSAVNYFCGADGNDYLAAGTQVTRLTAEEVIRFGLRPGGKPVSAVPSGNKEAWPVFPPKVAPSGKEWQAPGSGSNHEHYVYGDDLCNHCGKIVDECPEQGDHSAEIRELAHAAMW